MCKDFLSLNLIFEKGCESIYGGCIWGWEYIKTANVLKNGKEDVFSLWFYNQSNMTLQKEGREGSKEGKKESYEKN